MFYFQEATYPNIPYFQNKLIKVEDNLFKNPTCASLIIIKGNRHRCHPHSMNKLRYESCLFTLFLLTVTEDASHLHSEQTGRKMAEIDPKVIIFTALWKLEQTLTLYLMILERSSSSLKLNAPGYQLLLYWIMWLWNLNSKIFLCLKLVNWNYMDNISLSSTFASPCLCLSDWRQKNETDNAEKKITFN